MEFKNISLKEISISVMVAFMFLIVAYQIMNLSFTLPLAVEKPKLRFFEDLRGKLGSSKTSSWRDSILCIDVSHDQVFAMEYKNQEAIGETAVTDHEKLLKLLQALDSNNNYRFILLDILFDKSVSQPIDSQLYNYIVGMNNIVIPMPDEPIADDRLLLKTAHAKYASTHWDGGFTKYPYMLSNMPSIPLYMYEKVYKHKIANPLHSIWWDRGFARNCVFLSFDLKDFADDDPLMLPLGRCLGYPINGVAMNAKIKNKRITDGKYIIIGNFKTDRHSTFLGSMSGPMINFNAFVALVNGQHRINLILIVTTLLFLSLCCYAIMYSSKCMGILVRASRIKAITLILITLCLFSYFIYHIVYDIYIYVLLLGSLHVGVKYGVGYKTKATIGYFAFLLFIVISILLIKEYFIAWSFFIIFVLYSLYKMICFQEKKTRKNKELC